MGVGDAEHGTALRHHSVRADAVEDGLLDRFTAHPVFSHIEQIGQDAFLEVLLQRRFLSLMFPVMYDIGIDGLTDPTAVKVVREILREEYPDPSGATPSHREDLVADLVTLGATRAQVLASRPTAVTRAVIDRSFALLAEATEGDSDLELMTIIRFWGEDSATHSGRLGACLVRLLAGEDGEERFAATEARVLALRLEFYDQFRATPGRANG